MTESEMIDAMLEFYVIRGSFPIQIDNSNRHIHDSAIQKMKAYGLIEPTGFQSFNRATQKGYEAYYGGGIDKWITDTERRENEVRQATLDSAKATVDAAKSAKKSFFAAVITGAFSIIPIALSIFQFVELQSKTKENAELKSQLATPSQSSIRPKPSPTKKPLLANSVRLRPKVEK